MLNKTNKIYSFMIQVREQTHHQNYIRRNTKQLKLRVIAHTFFTKLRTTFMTTRVIVQNY